MTSPLPRHERATGKARKLEVGGQVTAGAIGSAFGAAKLRDAHREQYPTRHTASVKRLVRATRSRGASPQTAAKVARLATSAKPGFKTLVALTAAGATATGAHRAQEIEQALQRRRHGMAKALCGRCVEGASHPSRAVIKGREDLGPLQVVGYHGSDRFHLLDRHDSGRVEHRDRLTFIRPAKKGSDMSKSVFGIDELDKASREERRISGADRAHRKIANMYTRAGTHHLTYDPGKMPAHEAIALRNFNEAAGHNGGLAMYHRSAVGDGHSRRSTSHRAPTALTKIPKGKAAIVGAGAAAAGVGIHGTRKAIKASRESAAHGGDGYDLKTGAKMSKSAFGIDHVTLEKADDPYNSNRSFRSQGIAFKDKSAAKRTGTEFRRSAALVSSRGTNRKENWKQIGRSSGHGALGAAAAGGVAGALAGKGNRAVTAAAGAASGAYAGGAIGSAVGNHKVQGRALTRSVNNAKTRGDVTTGHAPGTVKLFSGQVKDKKDVSKSVFGIEH